MNINCFQYKALEKCKRFEIVGHSIIGYLKNGNAIVMPITENQFRQDHNKIVYGHKWELNK